MIGILPIILGAIATALISVLSLQQSVANRVGDSNDALVASTSFNRDVQSAQEYDNAVDTRCVRVARERADATARTRLGRQLLPQSSGGPAGGYDTVVLLHLDLKCRITQTHTTTYTLTRQVCSFGTSTTPNNTLTLAHDIGSAPTVTIYGPKKRRATSPTSHRTSPPGPRRSVSRRSNSTSRVPRHERIRLLARWSPGRSKSQSSAST